MLWHGESFSNLPLAVGALNFGNITTNVQPEDAHQNSTVIRLLGDVVIRPATGNQIVFGWHGIIVVKEDNLSTSEVPDPNFDNHDWLMRNYWNTISDSGNDGSQALRLGFDLKAKRRLKVNEDLAYIIKVDAGAAGSINWSAGWRSLFMR